MMKRGSASVEVGEMKRRFDCTSEKSSVGGSISGKWIKEGRGAGWARYRGMRVLALAGRER